MKAPPVPSFDFDGATLEVHNYNWARPFSNFLPGIAGPWGVPAWVFWVSRGQAIAGLGAEDRDGQILELMSFNKASHRVMTEGFRTFLRMDEEAIYEPFRRTDDPDISQHLSIVPAEFTLTDRHDAHGVEVTVTYHTLPGQRAAGLVRWTSVQNLSGRDRRIECVDGAPRVLPYGIDQHGIKVIPRHIEAMIGVGRRDEALLFRLDQSAADTAAVEPVRGANFYWSPATRDGAHQVADPVAVFGDQFAFDRALVFEQGGCEAVAAVPGVLEGRTPCAFTAVDRVVGPGETITVVSVFGRVERGEDLDSLTGLDEAGLAVLREENRTLVDEITDHCATVSSHTGFDAYCRQNFLDNVIRGGMPVLIDADSADTPVYAYSHQNGDLERDYHQFAVAPEYLSQGLGHYRNTAQNRRSDNWFFPALGDHNLKLFFGLIQLDGYNPLEVLPETYRVDDATKAGMWLREWVADADRQAELEGHMQGAFSIGRLAMWLEDAVGKRPPPEALVAAAAFLAPEEVGGIHAGFWVDHWHYALDLLESYLAMYPDRLDQVLLDDGYAWFDNPDVVVPRAQRIELTSRGWRQLGAIQRDREKESLIAARRTDQHRARTASGDVFHSTLVVKLLLLAATRLATLDPSGLGIEMEAGKPGWNDSLNGLPGLFGSGLSETIELRRLIRLLQRWLGEIDPAAIDVFAELADFIDVLTPLAAARQRGETSSASFWIDANDVKEQYRAAVRLGVSGVQREYPSAALTAFLDSAGDLLDDVFHGSGRSKVIGAGGVPHTYFVHRPEPPRSDQGPPDTFSPSPVEPFLEGPMHWLREFPEDARTIYDAVRTSPLYDSVLRMYKSSGPMGDADPELGRAVGAYPAGWLENESIYTHMEYKYLLEVLRSGLVEEFWDDARHCLPPFLNPAVYGRSPVEGVSFIVSSAHTDPSEHGRGYQPRLSGMTAEFISIWLLAALGPKPFRLTAGTLEFAPEPLLPGWLFTEAAVEAEFVGVAEPVALPAGSLAFRLLGSGTCSYLNRDRRNTYGPEGARCASFDLELSSGATLHVEGSVLGGDPALALRRGQVRHLRIHLR